MFSDVRAFFQSQGAEVLQPELHPSASIAYRSAQLKTAIEQAYGTECPIHLIGHSMGGLDARFLASPAGLGVGDRICTVITLGTPHRGSSVAPRIPRSLTWSVARAGKIALKAQRILPLLTRNRQYWQYLADDRWEALKDLSNGHFSENFNSTIVDHPAVRYYSYGGDITSGPRRFVSKFRAFLVGAFGAFKEPHDGLVTVESAKWGTFLGTIPADHGAMIGLQIIPGVSPGFDHLPFFNQLLYHLALQEQNNSEIS
jgi:triacylglycerol lipase